MTITFHWKGDMHKAKTIVMNRDSRGDMIGFQRDGEQIRITPVPIVKPTESGPKRSRDEA